jgi:hypothetical protein
MRLDRAKSVVIASAVGAVARAAAAIVAATAVVAADSPAIDASRAGKFLKDEENREMCRVAGLPVLVLAA